MTNKSPDFSELDGLKDDPLSSEIDNTFKSVIKEGLVLDAQPKVAQQVSTPDEISLSLDEGIELSLGGEEGNSSQDEGLELTLNDDISLDLSDVGLDQSNSDTDYGDLSLDGEELDEDLSDSEEDVIENLGELTLEDLGGDSPADNSLSLETTDSEPSLELDSDLGLQPGEEVDLGELSLSDQEFSDDALKKLEEIDAIMVEDASKVNIHVNIQERIGEENILDKPLVGEDINLDSLNFSAEESESLEEEEIKEEKPKKKKAAPETLESRDKSFSEDLKEISGAYSGEMERLQATISNLRTDREELLTKIQQLEDDKVIQNRQTLTMRAELDEKKIELTIIRKKLNEEISDLKDRLKLHDEKRLILEEKNRILLQELDKSAQKNKIDVKKVQMRERELEQKLELLKADAETQIRNRDLKILELKRRIDSMEFDMESISQQEKRSVESRFELEDKLEKAIKTLRNAINVLEDENERTNALTALKKNLDV